MEGGGGREREVERGRVRERREGESGVGFRDQKRCIVESPCE
jgi:hypothetical protein